VRNARQVIRTAGLVAGPLLAWVCWAILPQRYAAGAETLEFLEPGRATLCLMVWMAVWWLTEAIDIAATALLPVALLPVLGAATIGQATAPYADALIFLFLGGFLMALSMQRWGLDRRIALITLRLVGTRPAGIVAGVMLPTALISMFVSNTATAAMMLPIALSVVALVNERSAWTDRQRSNFALAMMLGIAYSASIGGIGTKIGTPPNGLLLAYVEQTFGRRIDFAGWLRIGLPFVAVLLPLSWWLLSFLLYPVPRERLAGASDLFEKEYASLGRVKPGEWATFLVFCAAALLWVVRPLLAEGISVSGDEGPRQWLAPLLPGLSDAAIAVAAGLALFVIPVDLRLDRFALDWSTAQRLPWGILILFGGGLSLAAAVTRNGVAEFIGHGAAGLIGRDPPAIVPVLVVTTTVVFLTELTSNTATTATLLPILAALAPALGVHPFMLLFPAAIAASCAFMMPVATPPNAIVFASGHVTIPQMCRAGLWLNLLCIVIITLIAFLLVAPLTGGTLSP
jgi:sodium-dependent dicarboxylate transporter 2/3/5